MQGFWNLIGKSGQGPGKDFQYEISEKILSSLDTKSLWSLHHGKKKVTAEIVSLFVCDGKSSTPEEMHLAKSACKRLKTLRHPNIIKFLDAFESENLVYVVTEPVIPLSTFLDEEDGRNPNLITWGLHQVITGLSFLINDGNLLHENVNIYSVFVGLDGEWKLGGVEYVHTANTDSVAKLACLSCYDPPEVKTGNKRKEKWSSDAWGLGCLIWEIYNGALQNSSDLKNIKKIPKPLVVHYCDLVSANPKSRTNPKLFLEKTKEPGQFLCNDFIKANLFLSEIQIKDQKEQKDFFSSLDKTLDGFPKQFCVHKVLPQLLNAFEYGTAGSAVLSPLFKVGLLLDEAAYQAKILPCIIKLFSSNDRATRIQLLQQMEKFIKHLQPSVVDSQIFPCVSTGFGDTLPAMREQTIKAMLLLTPKLSEKTINNNLLRYFAKLQMDEQPGIRTNTTICLGRIAQHLSTATRQKVLIPAFTRALRDPFPPARRAGVQSISATQEFYKITDVASKVLPALCNLLVDPEQNVRDNTFTLVKVLMKKLEEYSKDPNSALNNQDVAEKEANGEGSTWTGWAVTSITSRFYQQKQETQNLVPSQHNNDIEKDSSGKDGNNSNRSNSHQSKSKAAQPEEQDVSDSSDYNDAWGDEEWQDVKEETLESANVQASIIGETDSKFNAVNQFDARQNNDSDSDYGDEWGDSGWGDKKAKDSGVLGGNETNDWGKNKANEWGNNSRNDGATEQGAKKKKTTGPANKPDEPSVAQLLGISSDGNDFLTGEPDVSWGGGWSNVENASASFTSKLIDSAAVSKEVESKQVETSRGDWGGDSWGDAENWGVGEKSEEERKKEQRKLELQRKREERKQQREQANKEKRTAKSGGALKLGVVKKGS